MLKVIRKGTIAAAIAVAALVATFGLVAAPASAHSFNDAVRSSAGCNWPTGSYSTREYKTITNSNNIVLGQVSLLWHGGRGENCVVTMKQGSMHGRYTPTTATLYREGLSPAVDSGVYAHYAAAAKFARNICVAYRGWIRDYRDQVDYSAGRSKFGNCGG